MELVIYSPLTDRSGATYNNIMLLAKFSAMSFCREGTGEKTTDNDTYDEVETARSHDIELTNYDGGHNAPQEIEIHLENMDEASTNPENTQSQVTMNPFYKNNAESQMEDPGYLTGATYRNMSSLGRDATDQDYIDQIIDEPVNYNDSTTVISDCAAQFVSMNNIEGEIVEEVDYQNVTIIKTKKKHAGDYYDDIVGGRGPAESDVKSAADDYDDDDYLSIDSNIKEDLASNDFDYGQQEENLYENVSRPAHYHDNRSHDAESMDYENSGVYRS